MEFYTNIDRFGNNLLVRGYRDGQAFFEKIRYTPSLFIPTKKDTKYSTIRNIPVEEIVFDSMSEANQFIDQYKDVDNFVFYGMEKYDVQYRHSRWPNEIRFDKNLIRVCYLDIETDVGKYSGDTLIKVRKKV